VNRWTRRVRAIRLPKEIGRPLHEFDPDLILCFDIASAAILKDLAPQKARVVWLGDLVFEALWYHNLYDAKERTLAYLRLPLSWFECFQWRGFYREVLAGAGCVIEGSASSARKLADLGIRAEYLPYPWPVSSRYVTASSSRFRGSPTFLFFGTLSGLGSRSAFRFLIDKLYPRLLTTWSRSGFRVYICGNLKLPDWVADALTSRPELIFKGFVEDLERLGRECHAVLVPIDIPVGNRSRIVTAMAYGWTIIAHVNASLGNPDLVSGRNCLLADDAGQFARHMQYVVAQPDVSKSLGDAARDSYQGSFAPEVATERILQRLSRTLSTVNAACQDAE